MKSPYGKRATQVAQIRSAFRDLLELNCLSSRRHASSAERVARKFRHAGSDAPKTRRAREIKRSTINRNIAALRAALNRATECC